MMAFVGGVLVLAGFLGGAFCYCADGKRRLFLLKMIRRLYEQIKYEISYGKEPIPMLLQKLSFKKNMIFGEEFRHIAEEMNSSGKKLDEIWNVHLQETLKKTPLKKQEQDFLLCFPEKLGFLEQDAQARALDELLYELQIRIAEVEKEQKSRNKVIISMGLAGGMLLTILLI